MLEPLSALEVWLSKEFCKQMIKGVYYIDIIIIVSFVFLLFSVRIPVLAFYLGKPFISVQGLGKDIKNTRIIKGNPI